MKTEIGPQFPQCSSVVLLYGRLIGGLEHSIRCYRTDELFLFALNGADLKRNATAVAAKGALIITSKSKDKPDAQKSKQRAKKPLAVSWKKGFLSSGPYAHDSQQV